MLQLKLLLLLVGVTVVFAGSSHPRNRGAYSLPDVQSFEERFKILEAQEEEQEQKDSRNPIEAPYRLPENVVPYHYWVQIQTDVHTGNRAFTGKVDLYFNVTESTREIVVHNRGLVLSSSTLYVVLGSEGEKFLIDYPRYVIDGQREFLRFTSRLNMEPGVSYVLCLEYSGYLRTDMDGFYLSSYVNDEGERRYLGVTQFQAISARTAFPCFDEPGLKVTVDLRLIHHLSYKAVSNMPELAVGADPDSDYVETVFERTPRMSIYLLAFLVSDFEYVEREDQRVLVRPNAVQDGELALEIGLATLEALGEHTGIPYSTYAPKMDQAAIPDFSAGAMENWGLCTYQEQYLLYTPDVTNFRTRKTIATIIAHEYAHQWFGNLVTAEWWSYLWLNEGFATLYEYYASEMAAPRMEYMEMFTLEVVQWALYADSLDGTRPMSYSRGATEGLIGSLFDSVAYDKSGAILNMFRGVLGDDAWQQAIHSYLTAHSLHPVNPSNLIDAMAEAAEDLGILPDGVSMEDFVTSWTDQAGYPVLDVRRNYVSNEIIISQDRFFSNRIEDDLSVWIVPYNVVNQSFADFGDLTFDWLTGKAVRLSTNVQDDRWIIVNKQQAGFYRVNYDLHNWYLIIDALTANWASVHRLNRAQLLDDAFELARSNRLDMEVVLDFMEYLQNELEYPPWTAASPILSYFHDRVRGTDQYDAFVRFVHTITSGAYATLSVDSVGPNETNLHKYLKQTVTTWACRTGLPDCLSRTGALLQSSAEAGEPIHPDIGAVTYCYGLRDSTKEAFVFVYDLLKASRNQVQRAQLIDSLGCSNDQEELRAFLYTAIGGDIQVNYSPAERRRVLSSVAAGSRDGVDALIDFLLDMYTDVVDDLGLGALNTAVMNIASRTNNVEEQERLEHLLETLGNVISTYTAASARATVARNLQWPLTREGLIVASFLENHYPATNSVA